MKRTGKNYFPRRSRIALCLCAPLYTVAETAAAALPDINHTDVLEPMEVPMVAMVTTKHRKSIRDDDVAGINALGDQFPDGIPKLRTTDKLLMLHPGGDEGVIFFENTRGNRRQLIRRILDQLHEGEGEEDEAGFDDIDAVFVKQEPDYDADPDRPVEAKRNSNYRYAW